MPCRISCSTLCFILAVAAGQVSAQGAEIAFGGLTHDASQPVEIGADQLKVDQSDGAATFTGNVVIGQGDLRLSAGEVRVEYLQGDGAKGRIDRLLASGGVTLVTPTEAAEAREAVYSVAGSEIVMTGDVVLTQGQNVLTGQKMTVNLTTGTAVVEGRVSTVLQTGGAP